MAMEELQRLSNFVLETTQKKLAEFHMLDKVVPFLDDRLVICGFPGEREAVTREDRALRPLTPLELRRFIQEKHGADCNFVVWNLSGRKYPYDELNGKIVEYSFPFHPAPPFLALCELATSVKGWLDSDPKNVAVVHDLSGRRSVVVVACVLDLYRHDERGAWGVGTTQERRRTTTLARVIEAMGRVGKALVPSQVRYFSYFSRCNIAAGVFQNPVTRRVRLARIIVNGIPDFLGDEPSPPAALRCLPVLRIYDEKGAVVGGTPFPRRSVNVEEGSFSLTPLTPCPVEEGEESEEESRTTGGSYGVPEKASVLDGDVLLRVFHCQEEEEEEENESGSMMQRKEGAAGGGGGCSRRGRPRRRRRRELTPMFALMFHTGFVPTNNAMRFTKDEIDGAMENPRFPSDFFLDLFFFEEVASPPTTDETHAPQQQQEPSRVLLLPPSTPVSSSSSPNKRVQNSEARRKTLEEIDELLREMPPEGGREGELVAGGQEEEELDLGDEEIAELLAV